MHDTPVYCSGYVMVHLCFTAPLGGDPREVSAEAFVLRGGQLESQPQAEPIAFSLSDCWELETDRFGRLECSDRVVCLFEEDGSIGERQGPFTGLAVVEGTLRCGERVIATLRGSYWQSEQTRRAWPRVRMVEARPDPAQGLLRRGAMSVPKLAPNDCPQPPGFRVQLRTLILHEACQTAGGIGPLAGLLCVSAALVNRWLEGEEEAPDAIYQACIDIVLLHPDGATG